MSDSSSDLFELDNLKYQEEFPVYETTHLDTNRVIANGLIFNGEFSFLCLGAFGMLP